MNPFIIKRLLGAALVVGGSVLLLLRDRTTIETRQPIANDYEPDNSADSHDDGGGPANAGDLGADPAASADSTEGNGTVDVDAEP